MAKVVRLDNHLHVGKVWGGRNEDTPADTVSARTSTVPTAP